MEYIAHVRKDGGTWYVHDLEEHLLETARISGEFADKFGARELGYLLGLWHDIGKYKREFQNKIRVKSGYDPEAHMEGISRVEHAITGALYAAQNFQQKIASLITLGDLFAIPIISHHTGLKDLQEDIQPKLLQSSHEIEALKGISKNIPDKIQNIPDLKKLIPSRKFDNKALFIKLLYSCLVDADFLDTESFMDPQRSGLRNTNDNLNLHEMNRRLNDYLEHKKKTSPDTPVNRERQSLLSVIEKKADLKPGFFSLTIPTGGGKTLTSLSFALKHAIQHSKERIIYAIPYTSIIEQTADVFREAVGDVLEHHSSLDPLKETSNNRLLTENWNSPLIVTTNVQLFESFYKRKSSRNRKLHNITNSVIILDEAQMLPPDYLLPALDLLKTLVNDYSVTVIFCTATQPSLQSVSTMNFRFHGVDSVTELVPYVGDLYEKFKRVSISLPEKIIYPVIKNVDEEKTFWENLANKIKVFQQVLAIVNTKKQALDFYHSMPKNTIHLSANMCAEHRSQVIQEIKDKLENKEEIRVVSTQLVEAGVDIDFPVVFRAMAGIDSIAQSAGRCNREGKMQNPGSVFVFMPPKMLPPGHLRQTAEAAKAVIEDNENVDVLSPEIYRQYYQNLLWTKGDSLDKKQILQDLDLFKFETVDKNFNLIENTGKAVVVPFGKASELTKKFEITQNIGILRKLQRYTVNIPEKIFDLLLKERSIIIIQEILPVLVEPKYYDRITGFNPEKYASYAPEEMII